MSKETTDVLARELMILRVTLMFATVKEDGKAAALADVRRNLGLYRQLFNFMWW
ncbi:MAG: hypothetical protein ACLT46_02125 [Hungatella sp.]